MIKLGIIGAGKIIQSHIDAAKHVGISPLAIVARDNSQSAYNVAEKNSELIPCRNLDEFFKIDFDAILIATSEDSKIEILTRALEVKKPILIEKPVFSKSNYEVLKNQKDFELVKVAYNRRNYSSVQKFKHEMANVSNGIIQINLPELSWVSLPEKELVYEMAYTNSIHIIDLLGYLISKAGFAMNLMNSVY